MSSLSETDRESLQVQVTRTSTGLGTSKSSNQQRLTEMGSLVSKKSTTEINRIFGMAIFAGSRPFSMFESVEMKALFQALNPDYKIPGRTQLSTTILQDCYTQVKLDVEKQISNSQYLNISVDESTDIRKRRIVNISATDGKRSYFIASKDVGATSMNAVSFSNWTFEQVRHLSEEKKMSSNCYVRFATSLTAISRVLIHLLRIPVQQ
jgi:hypothetical protein